MCNTGTLIPAHVTFLAFHRLNPVMYHTYYSYKILQVDDHIYLHHKNMKFLLIHDDNAKLKT